MGEPLSLVYKNSLLLTPLIFRGDYHGIHISPTQMSNPLVLPGFTNPTNTSDFSAHSYDANGDGLKDFVLHSFSESDGRRNTLFLVKADGSGLDAVGIGSNLNPYIFEHGIGDINADGYNDLVSGNKVYLWNGAGYGDPATGGPIILTGVAPHASRFHDINGDGLPDLFQIDSDNSGSYLVVHENQIGTDPDHIVSTAFQSLTSRRLIQDDVDCFEPGGGEIVPSDPGNVGCVLDITEIKNVVDIDGDGVSELVLKGEYEYCFDDPAASGACQAGGSVSFDVWLLATLRVDEFGDLSYFLSSIAPGESFFPYEKGYTSIDVIDLDGDGSSELCAVSQRNLSTAGEWHIKEWSCYESVAKITTFTDPIFIKSFTVDGDIQQFFRIHTYEDVNADGLIDLMYSDGKSHDSTWKFFFNENG